MENTPLYNVIVSEIARQMLISHIRFVAERSTEAAHKTNDRLIDAIASLSLLPERFPFFNEEYMPVNKYHKMFVEKWYLILYQIKDTTVYVDFIVDCRQDYQWLIF